MPRTCEPSTKPRQTYSAPEGKPSPRIAAHLLSDAANDGLGRLDTKIGHPLVTIFTQAIARELAQESHLAFACGRYEGIDQRVIDYTSTRASVRLISLGDYVLNGGEVATMAMIEAIGRLVPGLSSDFAVALVAVGILLLFQATNALGARSTGRLAVELVDRQLQRPEPQFHDQEHAEEHRHQVEGEALTRGVDEVGGLGSQSSDGRLRR